MRCAPRPIILALLAAILLLPGSPANGADLEVPELQGRVNDYGNLLTQGTERQLETLLAGLEQTDSTQIVILTIPSLEGAALEDFSIRVVERWKIGRQDLDNGALLLIARDERKIWIEVGYGLEGVLTDLTAGRIIRNVISPRFRQGDFDGGVRAGIEAMIAAVRGEFEAAEQTRAKPQADFGGLLTSLIFVSFFFGSMFRKNKLFATATGGVVIPLLGLFFFGIGGLMLLALIPVGAVGGLVASSLAASSGVGRYGGHYGGWGGSAGGFGGSTGGFGGFSGGGGGFGGGGASGGW